MEEQIKKLQEELELVKKERDNLILEMNKAVINTRLKDEISNFRKIDIKKRLLEKNYISALYQTYETNLKEEKENEGNQI